MGIPVHTNEPFTGVQIGEETTWGVAATVYHTLPLVQPGESMNLDRQQIQEPTAFGGTGARETVEYGRSTGRGSITVECRPDSIAFNLLLAHAIWGETLVVDTYVDGTAITAANSGNLHIYAPGTVVPTGLTIKIWKAGIGPAANGWVEIFRGAMITSWRFVQANDQRLLATFNFISKSQTISAGSGTISAIGGAQIINFRSLSANGAYFKTGATLAALGIDGFSLSYDRKLEIDAPYITSPDQVDQPGAAGLRVVTLDIDGRLEQDYYSVANKPAYEAVNRITSKADILYVVGTAIGNKFYAMRIELPKIDWDSTDNSLKDPGNPPTKHVATASLGAFDATSALPDAQTGDLRVMTVVKVADDGDAKFSNF